MLILIAIREMHHHPQVGQEFGSLTISSEKSIELLNIYDIKFGTAFLRKLKPKTFTKPTFCFFLKQLSEREKRDTEREYFFRCLDSVASTFPTKPSYMFTLELTAQWK